MGRDGKANGGEGKRSVSKRAGDARCGEGWGLNTTCQAITTPPRPALMCHAEPRGQKLGPLD